MKRTKGKDVSREKKKGGVVVKGEDVSRDRKGGKGGRNETKTPSIPKWRMMFFSTCCPNPN
jgi:hypothetical protein